MKNLVLGSGLLVLLGGCFSSDSNNPVVSQEFVHKYGFGVTEEEWQDREQDGQIVSILKNGIRVTRSFENGALHGSTTYTFPHSSVIERIQVYDQGNLLKEVVHDASGMPMREEVYEFDDRKIITSWDAKGAPMSLEEYNGELLVEGKYFTPEHELEGQVEAGYGERYKRERSGVLVSRDFIENGAIASRTSYHPNGLVHTISRYKDYQLHGEQEKFTSTGKPLMTLNWNQGVLDGLKIVYRNGVKVAEIPYVSGQKNGMESHFDDLGTLTAQIEWKHDKKHGSSKFFTDESVEQEWFFKGQSVAHEKFELMNSREQLVADLHGDLETDYENRK
jgi:antitoxin component YwqK of YwqJK toxin-antitoxin module